MKKGFTLVELAIVLVIIGLLVGGILAGQELVKQSVLRDTLLQIKEADTAAGTFRSKYDQIPGDFSQANYFGIDALSGGSQNVSATANSNFDGDNDGRLDGTSNDINSYFDGEIANFWVHLSNSGFIEGSYKQNYGCYHGGATECGGTAGVNFPKTGIGTGLIVTNAYNTTTNTLTENSYYILGLGSDSIVEVGTTTPGNPSYAVGNNLTPKDAYQIDVKYDDGNPRKGRVIAIAGLRCSNCIPEGLATVNPAPGPTVCYDYSSSYIYNTSLDTKVCTVAIKTTF